jgi:predicted MFS family arabinose efflux permease
VLFLTSHSSIAFIIVVTLLFGIASTAFGTNSLVLYTQVRADQVGTASGLLRTWGYMGSIASSAIIAIVFRTGVSDHGLHKIGWVMISVSVVALLLVVGDRVLMRQVRAEMDTDKPKETDEPKAAPATRPASSVVPSNQS